MCDACCKVNNIITHSLSKESNVIVHRYNYSSVTFMHPRLLTARSCTHIKFTKKTRFLRVTFGVQVRLFEKQRHAKDFEGSAGIKKTEWRVSTITRTNITIFFLQMVCRIQHALIESPVNVLNKFKNIGIYRQYTQVLYNT
jgi:hypothetical protein